MRAQGSTVNDTIPRVPATLGASPVQQHLGSEPQSQVDFATPKQSFYCCPPQRDQRHRRRRNPTPSLAPRTTFFASLFARLQPRIDGKGAAWAVAHRIAKVIWLILHNGVEYEEKRPATISERTLLRKLRRLMREFGKHGIDVKSLLEQDVAAHA